MYAFAVGEIERVMGMYMRSCVSPVVVHMTMRMSCVLLYFCAWKFVYNAKFVQ